jgi:hypothetical protein
VGGRSVAVKSLRRRFRALVGGLLLLCLALAGPATAAAPAPDPPPLAVTPEAPQPEPASKPAPVRQAPVARQPAPVVVTPRPVVTRRVATPIVVEQDDPAKPAAAPVKKKPVAKKAVPVKAKPNPKPKPAVFVARPHDRSPVPLATLIPSVEELDRGMLVLAGAGLAFVALGGAVVLLAARRELGELAR